MVISLSGLAKKSTKSRLCPRVRRAKKKILPLPPLQKNPLSLDFAHVYVGPKKKNFAPTPASKKSTKSRLCPRVRRAKKKNFAPTPASKKKIH